MFNEIPEEYVEDNPVEAVTTSPEVSDPVITSEEILQSITSQPEIFSQYPDVTTEIIQPDSIMPMSSNLPSAQFDFNTLLFACCFIVVCLIYFKRS